jgi:hypothetical protein
LVARLLFTGKIPFAAETHIPSVNLAMSLDMFNLALQSQSLI